MFTFDAGERVSPWLATMKVGRDTDSGTTLPPADCQPDPLQSIAATAAQTVYIVEDGAPICHKIRATIRSLLPADGGVIRTYRTVDAFMARAKEHDPGVVIVNSCLSASGSIALLCGLRSGELAFAVILLTMQPDVALAVSAMKHGAVDVLAMPCAPQTLKTSMEAAFDQVERRFAVCTATMAARARIARLSRRERTVLTGIVQGWSNKRMANDLDLSPRTVEIHRANLMHKLGAGHLADVMRIVYAAGMIDQL